MSADDSIRLSQAEFLDLLHRVERLEKASQTASTSQTSSLPKNGDTNHHAVAADSDPEKGTFYIGGYGEATMKRCFYSNNYLRYNTPDNYRNEGFGQFDLPHVCIWMGYNFGRGWSFGTEVEFEHGGTESAVEIEEEEGGEYETEVERGGEVALEQLWIQKEFARYAAIRAGMIIVPMGGTNAYHEPNRFFGVFRPEGENTILPCTWHDIGLEFHGRYRWLGYTAQFLPGLESDQFGNKSWIHYGSASAYEFKLANTYAGLARLDFYPLDKLGKDNLRISVSGYCGTSFRNYLLQDLKSVTEDEKSNYYGVKGLVSLVGLDWCYDDHHVIFRGSAVYGHLGDANKISKFNLSQSSTSVSKRQIVGSDAYAVGAEIGYDFFHFNHKLVEKKQKFYLFARYDIYDSQAKVGKSYTKAYWCGRQKVSAGINYYPLPEVIIKAEAGCGFLNQNPDATSKYSNEPYIALSVNYAGIFFRSKKRK